MEKKEKTLKIISYIMTPLLLAAGIFYIVVGILQYSQITKGISTSTFVWILINAPLFCLFGLLLVLLSIFIFYNLFIGNLNKKLPFVFAFASCIFLFIYYMSIMIAFNSYGVAFRWWGVLLALLSIFLMVFALVKKGKFSFASEMVVISGFVGFVVFGIDIFNQGNTWYLLADGFLMAAYVALIAYFAVSDEQYI